MVGLLKRRILSGVAAFAVQSGFAASGRIPLVELPTTRVGCACQAIAASAEKMLTYAANPDGALVLENPMAKYSNAYPIVEQANVAFKSFAEAILADHAQTLLEARTTIQQQAEELKTKIKALEGTVAELEEANGTIREQAKQIGGKETEVENLKVLLPPTYNTPITVVSVGDESFGEKFSIEEMNPSLMISRFPGNWIDFNIDPENITSLWIPNNIISWPQSALLGCTNLEHLYTYGPELKEVTRGITLTGSYFGDRTKLKTLQLPSLVIAVGSRAFNGCSNLISIKFSASFSGIGEGAFWSSGLTSLDLSPCSALVSSE